MVYAHTCVFMCGICTHLCIYVCGIYTHLYIYVWYMHTCIATYTLVQRPEATSLSCSIQLSHSWLYSRGAGSLMEPGSRLVSGKQCCPQKCYCFHHLCWGYNLTCSCLAFYMNTGDSNSYPHSSFANKCYYPSSHSQLFTFYFDRRSGLTLEVFLPQPCQYLLPDSV